MIKSLNLFVAIAFVSCISLSTVVNSFIVVNHRIKRYQKSSGPEHCER